MIRKLPSLNALRAFEAAARLESLTLAAGELNVAQAAISRHVRELETWLGAKLFHRTGRGVTLTQQGATLARELTRAFDLLAAAVDPFESTSKPLVVSSDVSFAALWLVPRLKRFLAAYPGIEIVVDPDSRLIDYAKGEADIGIRYGRGSWKGVACERLFDSRCTPVCAPNMPAASALEVPADLLGQPLIREDRSDGWPEWFQAADVVPKALSGPQVRGELAISAAEAGTGFALADLIQAGDGLMAGRLIQVFDITSGDFGYYLVHAEGARLNKSAAAFAEWIKLERDRFVTELENWKRMSRATPKDRTKGRRSQSGRL